MHFFLVLNTLRNSTEIKEPMHSMAQIYANTSKRVLQGILKKQQSLDLTGFFSMAFARRT